RPAGASCRRSASGTAGRLLVPVGTARKQRLLLISRDANGWEEREVEDARFVPLVGEEGW
ncbi:MAG: protein-L-isoaspartate O-methyltransferase, partial [Gemmatimonadota bacterium]